MSIVLRDMIESDIEDYVRWFTVETEWGDWDAPWEPLNESADEVRARYTARCEKTKRRGSDELRWRYEIECDGKHIGWVSAYTDLGEWENPEGYPAVGITVADPADRGGTGTEALRQFIDYLRTHGHNVIYTQTWSGNARMLRVAEKLGFREAYRKEGICEVRGKTYDALTLRLEL